MRQCLANCKTASYSTQSDKNKQSKSKSEVLKGSNRRVSCRSKATLANSKPLTRPYLDWWANCMDMYSVLHARKGNKAAKQLQWEDLFRGKGHAEVWQSLSSQRLQAPFSWWYHAVLCVQREVWYWDTESIYSAIYLVLRTTALSNSKVVLS